MAQSGQHNSGQATSDQVPNDQQISENDLIAQRHAKLNTIVEKAKQAGSNAWPNHFKRDHYAGDLQEQYKDSSKEDLAATAVPVTVAGRLMLNRGSFMVMQDMTGRIQLYVNRKVLSADELD